MRRARTNTHSVGAFGPLRVTTSERTTPLIYDVRAEFETSFDVVTADRIDKFYDVLEVGGLSNVALIFQPSENRVVMIGVTDSLGILTLFTQYWFRVFGGIALLTNASFQVNTTEGAYAEKSRELADARGSG